MAWDWRQTYWADRLNTRIIPPRECARHKAVKATSGLWLAKKPSTNRTLARSIRSGPPTESKCSRRNSRAAPMLAAKHRLPSGRTIATQEPVGNSSSKTNLQLLTYNLVFWCSTRHVNLWSLRLFIIKYAPTRYRVRTPSWSSKAWRMVPTRSRAIFPIT